MKKLIAALSLMLVLVLTSCSTPSPTSVTTSFLDGVKKQDSEIIASVYADGKDFGLSSKELSENMEDDATGDDIFADYSEEFTTKLLDFDYEITDEVIEGDKATVNVNITTYSFGSELSAFFNEYITEGLMLAFEDNSEEKLEALEKTLMQKMIDNLSEKSYTGSAKLSLSKTDKGWIVDEIDDDSEFMDVITGGTITAVNNLNALWSE